MSNMMIIAEMSANHAGSLHTAIETIKAAKRAGADAIKFQTYTADTITLNCRNDDFKISQGTLWDGKYLHDLYQEAYTPWEWHEELFRVAREEGLIAFSTPFDRSAVDFLESLGNPIYKIASFEITDIPLIEYAASKGKPMVISTGIASLEDIELAVDACKSVGNQDITLLKCTSSYPAPLSQANLVMISDLARRFGVKAGLSDHTMGSLSAILAVSQGATIIEKHFIIDRSIGGPDSAFSMNEKEFTEMVKLIRDAELAMGEVDYSMTDFKLNNRTYSRSLYISADVKKGDIISDENIRSVRPCHGLHTKYYKDILGKKFSRDMKLGDRLSLEDIE